MSDPNFDNMTAEQIKAFIESQPAAEEAPEETEQPRDEQGRFVSPEAETEGDEPTVEEVPEMYVREIDLGDGSGVQVFKAPTPEELADKIADAHGHATRKIQELSQRLKALEQAQQSQPTQPTLNPDEEARLSQRILAEPSAAIREIMVREFGMTPAEVKAKLEQANQVAQAQAADAASREFVAATPDYYACEANGKKIIRWLEMNGKLGTVENIAEAYQDLRADGLLVAKPTEQPAPRAARSSGLSTRRSVSPPVQKPADTSKMTLEQLRELAGGYQNIY